MKGLKQQLAAESPRNQRNLPLPKPIPRDPGNRPPSRIGKRAIVGHFSPEMSMRVAIMARMQEKTVQALIGEALDDLLVKYGERAFGER